MTNLNDSFHNHLSQGLTTVCQAWILTLADGTQYGLTDHDAALDFLGLDLIPNQSLLDFDVQQKAGFAADNGAIQTELNIDALSGDAVRAGALNDATLTQYKLNWASPDQYAQMAHGLVSDVRVRGDGFEADWIGLSSRLNRNTGRLFSRRCDAQLGDGRCGVSLSTLPGGTTCPKTLDACRDQFSNAVNFRGFPYLLGDYALQSGPVDSLSRDGGSRYRGLSL